VGHPTVAVACSRQKQLAVKSKAKNKGGGNAHLDVPPRDRFLVSAPKGMLTKNLSRKPLLEAQHLTSAIV
jgi:hypothetical protein